MARGLVAALALLTVALGTACSGGGDESEPLTLEQYFGRVEAVLSDYNDRIAQANADAQADFGGSEDAGDALAQAIEVLGDLIATSRPILSDLVTGLAEIEPPLTVAEAHTQLLDAERAALATLDDLASKLERGEGEEEALAAVMSNASNLETGRELARAIDDLEATAEAEGITVVLRPASDTPTRATSGPGGVDLEPITSDGDAADAPVGSGGRVVDDGSQAVGLGEPFVLAVGGEATIARASVTVRFEGIRGDSRCPSDATCIRAGEAFAMLTVTATDLETPVELAIPPQGGAESAIEGWMISVTALSPAALTRHTIDPSEYELHLSIEVGSAD